MNEPGSAGKADERFLSRLRNNIRTWSIGTVAGVLVLGVISNGIWQMAGAPLTVQIRDLLLNLATLGLSNLKDSLYSDVASGLHESPSVALLTMVLLFMCMAGFGLGLYTTDRVRRSTKREGPIANDDEELLEHLLDRKAKLQTEVRRLRRRMRYLLYGGMWPVFFLLLLTSLFVGVRVSYTANAIGHYRQLISLIGPHVTEAEIKQFDSSFAQIRTARDYNTLTGKLADIARHDNLKLPKFEPW